MQKILGLTVMAAAIAMMATAVQAASPAEQRIAALTARVAEAPAGPVYVELAVAYAQRARETADPDNYALADAALDRALELRPGDFGAQRTRVAVLLGKHDFAAAGQMAETLNAKYPGDPTLLGYIVDAHVELGRYDEAWAVLPDLLSRAPGSPAALARASYLAEISGDLDSAEKLMQRALSATPSAEVEQRAWVHTHLAHLDRMQGEFETAAVHLDRALELFAGYHYALAEKASLARATGDAEGAVEWMQRRCEAAPHPECFFDLGLVLERAGENAKAQRAFARFEPAAREEMASVDNANGQLVEFYLKQGNAEEAARIATLERGRRGDVRTRTFYAAALAATGRHAEAMIEVAFVRAVGTVDPWIVETLAGISSSRKKAER